MRSMGMALATWAMVAATGCNFQTIQGSGVAKTETRKVDDFHAVEVGGAIQATVKIGDKPSVVLEGDDNLVPLIETKVEKGRLVIGTTGGVGYSTKIGLKATITAPKLDALEASGAAKLDATAATSDAFAIDLSGPSDANVSGLDAKSVTIKASGARHLTVKGKATSLTLDVSGACKIDADGLAAETVKADVSGASKVKVTASKSIAGDISGASHLDVAGSPASRSVTTSGVGGVSYTGSK